MKFELNDPYSLSRVEFYVQTIISRIKYMIKHDGNPTVKEGIELTDLLTTATTEYEKKVLAPIKRK